MTKTAMVWGAGSGIGRALVSQLEQQDWRVLAMARHLVFLGALHDGHRGVLDL